jgi:hypothetical protein
VYAAKPYLPASIASLDDGLLLWLSTRGGFPRLEFDDAVLDDPPSEPDNDSVPTLIGALDVAFRSFEP